MKFPLPADTFARVNLSSDDCAAIERLAQVVVDDTVKQYNKHLHGRQGQVDSTHWKLIKKKGDVAVYKQRRRRRSVGRDGPPPSPPPLGGSPSKKGAAQMPLLLTLGSMQGCLDDVMYGIENHTLDMMRIKSAYTDDEIVDSAVLATILTPTHADPLRALSIKWCVKGRPLLSRPFVRFRDSVYLESTGIAVTCTGERIGFQLHHSVEIPEIRDLSDMGIVRAHISLCCLYRQREENVVELYMTGLVDPLGDIHPSVAIASMAETIVSIWKNVHCAHMKKLTWMLSATPPSVVTAADVAGAAADSNPQCTVCHKSIVFTVGSKRSACRLCAGRICRRCRVRKKLCLISASSGDIVEKKISVCSRCMHNVANMSAFTVATHEVVSENPYAAYDAASIWSSSPSSSAYSVDSIDSADSMMTALELTTLASDETASTVSSASFRSESSAGNTLARRSRPSWRC